MYSRIGAAAYKEDLTNTITLCDFLDNPQRKFKSIHIAGTNGKGSVSHMLAAILQTAGYKTGLYTSPHLKDFRERVKLDGAMIPEQFVIDFTEKIRPLIEQIEPSFFEISVAMAFDYFSGQEVDIAIIEVGLGGRLDSTNIITPELAIITNIGWDHMNILGDTLEKIAFEKAGIIKENVPVIIGEQLPETRNVFEQVAADRHAPLHIATEKRQAMNWRWEKNELLVEVATIGHTDHKTWTLDLAGLYQTKNLLAVLETCTQLQQRGWKIDDRSIATGLKHTKKLTVLHGRWEIIHKDPMIVLDVAHNVDGINQLIQQTELIPHRQLHIVIGMVNDKEVEKIMKLLPKSALYYFTKAQIPRAMPEEVLAGTGRKAGLNGTAYAEVNEAIKATLEHAHSDDLVIVCGSVFLVGEVNEIRKVK